MSQRVHLGPLFGQTALFVSQPGDDVQNPQKNLIVDSRFDTAKILVVNGQPISGFIDLAITKQTINNQQRVWYRNEVQFGVTLPFIPAVWVGVTDNNVCNYPVRSTVEWVQTSQICVSPTTSKLIADIRVNFPMGENVPQLRLAYTVFDRSRG